MVEQREKRTGDDSMSAEGLISNGIALLALGMSAWSLYYSNKASDVSRTTSYQVQLASEKADAMAQYVQAFGNLMTSIDTRFELFGVRFEDPKAVSKFTDDDLKRMQEAANGWFKDYRDYTTKVNAYRSSWPKDVEDKIVSAGEAANVINQCLSVIELKPNILYPKFWADKRTEMIKICPAFPQARLAFNDRSQAVVAAMNADRRTTWKDLPPE